MGLLTAPTIGCRQKNDGENGAPFSSLADFFGGKKDKMKHVWAFYILS